jgi:hypothetical protein
MANLLSYQEILNETALNQIPAFFHNLPVLQRARCVCSAAARPSDAWARFGHCTPNHTPPWSRHTYSPTLTIPPSPHTFTCVWLSAIHRWRWIFPEPGSSLSYPRQRARREMEEDADWAHADLMMVTDENGLPPHHRIAPVFKVNRASEEEWKANALKSTNTLLDKLPRGDPETNMFTSLKTWLAMIELAHSQALLRPGGLEVIRAWAQSATERQRSALNNLLLKLTDHLTATRGITESKVQFGPKKMAAREPVEPPGCSLGRPSSAPIVHANQRNFEKRVREAAAAQVAAANAMIAQRKANPEGTKREIDTLKSTVPIFGIAKIGSLETTTQAQMRTVKSGVTPTYARSLPSLSGNPPASNFSRMIGGPKWHGDSMYKRYWQAADGHSRAQQDADLCHVSGHL